MVESPHVGIRPEVSTRPSPSFRLPHVNIPNEQTIPATGRDDTRNVAAFLKPSTGELSYRFEPEDAIDILAQLLEGEDWIIGQNTGSGLQEAVVFSADIYNITLRQAAPGSRALSRRHA